MARLQCAGGLWGFVVQTDEGEKVLCRTCFRKARREGGVKKVIQACGTDDRDEDWNDCIVYLCDGDGCISDSAPCMGELDSL